MKCPVRHPLAPMPYSPKALQKSYHAIHARVDGVVNNLSIDGSRGDNRMFEKQGRIIENYVARVRTTRKVGELVYSC